MRTLIVAIIFTLISGCSSNPKINEETNFTHSQPENISIVSHDWHTGFVIPAKDLQSLIPELGARFPNANYLEVGWGDKGFYQAEEVTTGLALQAIFWPTESIVHVVALKERPETSFPNSEVKTLCVDNERYALLIDFVSKSFQRDSSNHVIPSKHGIYGDSQFYEGEGDYYLFNTCNKWTAKGLKSAKFDIDPTFKLTAGSIMSFLAAQAPSHTADMCTKKPLSSKPSPTSP